MTSKVLQSMIQASRLAGLKIRSATFNSAISFKTKSSSADLVTETDVQCQELIIQTLLKDFPDHKIVGEESAEGTDYELSMDETFIIDPIDGTSNFARLIPHCAVLIARSVKKAIDCAVILDPFRGELFYAEKGKGAFMELLELTTLHSIEGQKPRQLRVNSLVKDLREATVLADLGYTRDAHGVALFLELERALLTHPTSPVRTLRVLGSCGLSLAWVACGRADCYVERNGPLIWDYAGGALLVQEAGGVACDPIGDDLDLSKRSILATSSQEIAAEIIACVKLSEVKAKQCV